MLKVSFTNKPISWMIWFSGSIEPGIYWPVCFSLWKGEMKSRNFLFCIRLSQGHRVSSLLGTRSEGASGPRGGKVGAACSLAQPADTPHPCLSAKTCQVTIDTLCENKNSGRVAAVSNGSVGNGGGPAPAGWQLWYPTLSWQMLRASVPGACLPLCTLSSQDDKPKHKRPSFLMLMFHDDSFPRCDSPSVRPPPPLWVSHRRLMVACFPVLACSRAGLVGDTPPSSSQEALLPIRSGPSASWISTCFHS